MFLSHSVSDIREGQREDDAVLVSAAGSGDISAFEQLVERHQKAMFNIAFRILNRYADAAEVAQDAFVSAYRHIGSFRGEAKFSTWLTAIVINLARNRLKQVKGRQRHEAYSLDDPIETGDGKLKADPPSPEPSALAVLEQKDRQKAVQDCIAGLEHDFREVLVLRDLRDYSYEEIGAMLKVREGTVKSRLFRAREAVKDCLKKVMGELF